MDTPHSTYWLPPRLSPAFLDSTEAAARLLSSDITLAGMAASSRAHLATSTAWLHAAGLVTDAEIASAWHSCQVVAALRDVLSSGKARLAERLRRPEVPAGSAWMHLEFTTDGLELCHEWCAYAAVIPVFSPRFPRSRMLRGLVYSVACDLGANCFVPDFSAFVESSWYLGCARDWLKRRRWSVEAFEAHLEGGEDRSDEYDFEEDPFYNMETPTQVANAMFLHRTHMQRLRNSIVQPSEYQRCLERLPRTIRRMSIGRWLEQAIALLAQPPLSLSVMELSSGGDVALEVGSVLVTDPAILEACNLEWNMIGEAGDAPSRVLRGDTESAIQVLQALERVSACAAQLHLFPNEDFT
ncbi:hypothetical protein E4T66_17730 [Sinimarinibacterium sp. CAU 1509]|uniref:hypothetical protein n=1 Tax=Sinimarinibacterium sp. CAU 1509 TaxID=2562283 RepID=UPI0010AD5960|nr:hypothetical protein [Sinimarinibacterium sp. CAU 1509]TJY57248.1 hypothetical protein E4T66_17730 [Sinimarinibacterium sp. CAU 1509]